MDNGACCRRLKLASRQPDSCSRRVSFCPGRFDCRRLGRHDFKLAHRTSGHLDVPGVRLHRRCAGQRVRAPRPRRHYFPGLCAGTGNGTPGESAGALRALDSGGKERYVSGRKALAFGVGVSLGIVASLLALFALGRRAVIGSVALPWH